MWRMIQAQRQSGSTDPYRIAADDGSVLSYAQVIEHWGNNMGFARFFSKQLAASALNAGVLRNRDHSPLNLFFRR